MKDPPNRGELLATGRDSDIYVYDERRVLRRSRRGHSMEGEARTMEYARARGYPVPAVDDVREGGTVLVMERVDGPLMIGAMGRRPWAIGRFAALLAGLHERLHEIPAPEWVPDAPCGEGDRLLHLDLHPLNVILSPGGPVVIDWPNAARGPGEVDVALTWVLLAAGDNPSGRLRAAVTEPFRARLVRSFLAPFDRGAVHAQLAGVARWKMADSNMTDRERAAMATLARDPGHRDR